MQNDNNFSSNTSSLSNTALITIRSRILSGDLKPGEHLAPERDLAAEMNISRSSLHQAILELEYQGFVTIIPRRGTIINDFRKYPTTQSLEALMSSDTLNIEKPLFDDMMDFRLWLEKECAYKACSCIYRDTYCEMLDIIDDLEAGQVDVADAMYSFHYKLTQASGNSLYAMVFRGFEPVLKAMIVHHYEVKNTDISDSIKLMKKLMNYIDNNQPDDASNCVSNLIAIGIDVLKERYSK